MGDTFRGDLQNSICNDCGETGCYIIHWGILVPAGQRGRFCIECWPLREAYYRENGVAKPFPVLV